MLALLILYYLITTTIAIVGAIIIMGLLMLFCWLYELINNLRNRE